MIEQEHNVTPPHADKAQPYTVYLSGPMRDHFEFNFPLFFDVEHKLGLLRPTWNIINPARLDTEVGFDPTGLAGTIQELEAHDFNLREVLADDLNMIVAWCQGIVLLPEWRNSRGAVAEYAAARAIDIDVYEWCMLTDTLRTVGPVFQMFSWN